MENVLLFVGLFVVTVGLVSILKPVKELKINNRKTGAIVFFAGLVILISNISIGMGVSFVGLCAAITGLVSIIKPLKKLGIHNQKTGAIALFAGLIVFMSGTAIGMNEAVNQKTIAHEAGYSSVQEYDEAIKAEAGRKQIEAMREAARIAESKIIKVDIRAILSDYSNNEVGADNKYKGETIETIGIVSKIGKDILGNLYVTLGTGRQFEIPEIQAFFDDSMNSQLGQLNKGTRLRVVCKVDGLLMNVMAQDCSIK